MTPLSHLIPYFRDVRGGFSGATLFREAPASWAALRV